eukprot:scaffold1404_cov166-Amphora_coffeaeformis.AAC.22
MDFQRLVCKARFEMFVQKMCGGPNGTIHTILYGIRSIFCSCRFGFCHLPVRAASADQIRTVE